MSKLTYKDKRNIYRDRKVGMSWVSLSSKYNINTAKLQYMVRLIDKHGINIVKTKKNKVYPIYVKQQMIERVINGESIKSVSVDEGLNDYSMLAKWVSKYKENGYNIVEKKKGRNLTMFKKPKQAKKDETIEEKVKRLEEENLYLKAELEYSKKLRAVVQARKNQQQKKK